MNGAGSGSVSGGGGGGVSGGGGGVWSDLGSMWSRRTRSLRMTAKRKGMVHRDTVQWDTVSSVSSTSELSECPTTGTDEMSEHDAEVNSSPVPPTGCPVFAVGSVETTVSDVLPNGSGPRSLGDVPRIDTPPTSMDSGVITDPLSGSWTCTSPPDTTAREGVCILYIYMYSSWKFSQVKTFVNR